jgi:hypothetical protein
MRTDTQPMRILLPLAFLILLLGCTAPESKPGRAALIVDFGNSTVVKKCIAFGENSTALTLLQLSGLALETKEDPAYGPALCGINGIGCPASNCFCGKDTYWGFYYDGEGGAWSYSNVGFGSLSDGNRTIVRDKAVIGFRWGEYEKLPKKASFGEICGSS